MNGLNDVMSSVEQRHWAGIDVQALLGDDPQPIVSVRFITTPTLMSF
jgi:hypothetical protein